MKLKLRMLPNNSQIIMKKNNRFRDLLGELFLIIGGFILAETIINQFLSLSFDVLPWWILPLFSLLLIITALDFKDYNESFIKAGLSALFLGGSIILIVLVKNSIITNKIFLWGISVLVVISLVMLYIKNR